MSNDKQKNGNQGLQVLMPSPAPNDLRTSGFTVTRKAMRPATAAERCFYCHVPIGGEHLFDCVLVNKRVKVRAVVEYEVNVPANWAEEQVLFQRNLGSWCGSNMIGELEALDEAEGCLCGNIKWEFVSDGDESFLTEE